MARAHPSHRGARRLRATLETHHAGTNLTRSDLEILFRELCRTHGLPAPKVNHRVVGKEVDFLFEHARLVVEADSWRYHKTRHAFENDRARDVLLARAGYRTLRFTDRQIATEPDHVAAAIGAVLTDRRAA
jgi:very-short-patch-repair endonuclease